MLRIAFLALALVCAPVRGQEYPARPVHLLVGFPPGGAVDLVARLLQPRLARGLNTDIVVENRPGAGGVLAAELTAKAAPDGYTLCLINHAALVISPAMRKVAYDPVNDFTPIARVVEVQNIFLVHPSVPASDLAGLVALAKAKPHGLNYATSGVGSAGHLTGALFASMAGIDWVHVPYKGGGTAMADFLAGQVNVFVATVSTAVPQIAQGKAKALAVSGARRAAALPDVPTVAESGWPSFESSAWFAIVGPVRLSKPIAERWSTEVSAILALPDVRAELRERGIDAFPAGPGELADYIRAERARWAPVVKAVGLQPN